MGAIAHWRESDSTEQSLADHLQGVGRLAGQFATKLGLASAGELIGLLHDLGKYSDEFQKYIGSATGLIDSDADDYIDADGLRGKVDHSSAGAQYIWQELAPRGDREALIAQVFALCIASHHSGLIDSIGGGVGGNFGAGIFPRRMTKTSDKTHLDEVRHAADAPILARAQELLSEPELGAGLHVLVDSIKRQNAGTSPTVLLQQIGLVVRMLFSCLIDADRIDTADFEHKTVQRLRPRGIYTAWPILIGRLESHLLNLAPRRAIDHLRQQISEHCRVAAERGPGVYTLTVPTGGGKTLASLRFALHHAEKRQLDRVIYVIPYTSIIDQNAREVRSILEPIDAQAEQGKVVLEHHASLTPEQQTWREKILTENWDAPVVYTTMVQLLETLFGGGTRGARRMHQLANSVLIFDEIQTLPVKCVHLYNNAINFLAEQCKTTVLLCTATQPLLNRVAKEKGAIRLKAGHELMPDREQLFKDLKRVVVTDRREPGGWSYLRIAKLALTELDRAGSCLVIVNTKDAARQVFQHCQAKLDAGSVFHLSTDMCPAHRKSVLGSKHELAGHSVIARLARGEPVLCVSTQLIEAGVDVDFGAVIRSLAGLDSIAQAAGRCNRNGRPEPGIVHVVNPSEEKLDKLPDILIGAEKAQRVLDDFKANPSRYGDDLIGPRALHDYYEYYFFQRAGEMDYVVRARDKVGGQEFGHDDTLGNLLACNG
jgi:CRISPR-associated endonuclease/helicase Cas3